MENQLIIYNFARMKGLILCTSCIEKGRKPKVLGKYEDFVGRGDLYLWCKRCGKEIHIKAQDISLDR